MKKIIAILMSVCLLVGLCACGSDSSSTVHTIEPEATQSPVEQAQAKLVEAYNLYCKELPRDSNSLASDNMSITLDYCGYHYYTYTEMLINEATNNINIYLGFSSALYDKMDLTLASDGIQQQTNSQYTVTWKFVPNKGLLIIYEVNPE